MLHRLSRFGAWAFLLLAVPAFAGTIQIDYSVTSLGGSLYRYDYSVFNNGTLGAGVPVQFFDILFDPNLYNGASLQIVSAPAINSAWSQQILQQTFPLPAAYDVQATAGGIPDGSRVSGFAVQFTWLGTGTPGSQPFAVYDPQDLLRPLQTGATSPEPGTISVLVAGLAFVGYKLKKRS